MFHFASLHKLTPRRECSDKHGEGGGVSCAKSFQSKKVAVQGLGYEQCYPSSVATVIWCYRMQAQLINSFSLQGVCEVFRHICTMICFDQAIS